VVVAVPVAPPETVVALGDQADEVISLETPSTMVAVGAAYVDFSPTSDEEVVALLEGAP
jgi:predicted phosphoribosyltransferase